MDKELRLRIAEEEIKRFGLKNFVRGELAKRGYSYADVANELKVSKELVRVVAVSRLLNKSVIRGIAKIIELPEDYLIKKYEELYNEYLNKSQQGGNHENS